MGRVEFYDYYGTSNQVISVGGGRSRRRLEPRGVYNVEAGHRPAHPHGDLRGRCELRRQHLASVDQAVYSSTQSKMPTSTTLQSLANPVAAGTMVSLTAVVSPAPPSNVNDSIDFYDTTTKTDLGSWILSSYQMTVVVPAKYLTAGHHLITATFSGDAYWYEPSTSSPVDEVVTQAAGLIVTLPGDSATAAAGTLRSAVKLANADAANGQSDTIVFDTAKMGGHLAALDQGPLELNAGKGTATITIDGGGQVDINAADNPSLSTYSSTSGR